MKKLKNLFLAAATFLAFGTIANAATTVDFSELTLTDNTGITKENLGTGTGTSWSAVTEKPEIKDILTVPNSIAVTTDKKQIRYNIGNYSYKCNNEDTSAAGYQYHTIVFIDENGKMTSECDTAIGKATDVKYLISGDAACNTFAGATSCTELSVKKEEGSKTSSEVILNQTGVTYKYQKQDFDLMYSEEKGSIYIIEATGTGGKAYYVGVASSLYSNKDSWLVKGEKDFSNPTVKTGGVVFTSTIKAKMVSGNGVVETSYLKVNAGDSEETVQSIEGIYPVSATKVYYKVRTSVTAHEYYAEISGEKFKALLTNAGQNPAAKNWDLTVNEGQVLFKDSSDNLYTLSGESQSDITERTFVLGGITLTYDDQNITFKKAGATINTLALSTLLLNNKASLRAVSSDKVGSSYFAYTTAPSGAYSNYRLQIFKMSIKNTDDDSLVLDAAEKDLEVGKELTLKATASVKDAPITWTSSDDSIATVKDGKVTGVKAGTATITATWGKLTATCKINVKTAEQIKKEEEEKKKEEEKKTTTTVEVLTAAKTLKPGETITIEKVVTNGNGATTFKSSNTDVATVDENGKVTAVKEGYAEITVTNNGVSGVAKITVKAVTAEDVKKDENVDNPHTGAAISIVSILALGSAGYVVYKKKGKNKFNRI